jgi:hypothetical protein
VFGRVGNVGGALSSSIMPLPLLLGGLLKGETLSLTRL